MRIWSKLAFIAVMPLLLSGCLWGPGKFQSELTLRKNGTFVMDYRGEILLQMPNDSSRPVPWADDMVRCYKDGSVKSATVELKIFDDNEKDEDEAPTEELRACTPAEIASEKAKYEKEEAGRLAKKQEEANQMAKLFGMPGSDDESSRRFAASLLKQQGWKSVSYRGKGVFDVVYHFEGSTRQDYAFPLMPDSDLMIPFVMIRPRTDGSVKVTAPALVGGAGVFAARAKALNLPNPGANDGPPSHAQGRFVIVTDGEILTNNSEDGPAPHANGRQVHWDVSAASDKLPEALIRIR